MKACLSAVALLAVFAAAPALAQVQKPKPAQAQPPGPLQGQVPARLPTLLKAQIRPGARPPTVARTGPADVRPPGRLSAADYQAMGPQLTTLANLPPGSLPPISLVATDLATPGGVLNVGLGPQPRGAMMIGVGAAVLVNASPVRQPSSPPYLQFQVGTAWATSQMAVFLAPIQGAGTYVITAYVETSLAKLDLISCDQGETVAACTTTTTTGVQNGKVSVVHEVTDARSHDLTLYLAPSGMTSGDYLRLFSVDFLRLR